jgi:hypothetical protein
MSSGLEENSLSESRNKKFIWFKALLLAFFLEKLRRLKYGFGSQDPRSRRALNNRGPRKRGLGTHPQCMARAFLALTSLNIRTASAGEACKFDHIARGE